MGSVRRWSLALVALLSIAGGAHAEMSFRAVTLQEAPLCRPQCPTLILAEGEITRNSAQTFLEFVRRHLPAQGPSLGNVVFIDSPGGSVMGSMALGTVWRKLGTTAVVARPEVGQPGWLASENTSANRVRAARCYSACVYALMGAKKRIVPDGSRVGVHQSHKIDLVRDLAGGVMRELHGSDEPTVALRAYAKTMGIDTALIELAQTTRPEDFRILNAGEMRRFRLSNSKL
ncbi:hypothetical protein [Terrarubrum flagellatum]|uniref:COG3904 family protein n=1 Tax=Terrirubrum flagellatum TaxID=2895980 RepID=UPI0031453302